MLNLFIPLLILCSIGTDSMCGSKHGTLKNSHNSQAIDFSSSAQHKKSLQDSTNKKEKKKKHKKKIVKEESDLFAMNLFEQAQQDDRQIEELLPSLKDYFDRAYRVIFNFKVEKKEEIDEKCIWLLFTHIALDLLYKEDDQYTITQKNKILAAAKREQTAQPEGLVPEGTITVLKDKMTEILQKYPLTQENFRRLRHDIFVYLETKRGKDKDTIDKRKSLHRELSDEITQEKMKQHQKSIEALAASLQSNRKKKVSAQ